MEIDVALVTYYTLAEDRQTPVRCSLSEWGRMMKDYQRRLVECEVMMTPEGEEIKVSTMFMGIDLSLGYGPAPLLWETMLFGDIDIGDQTDTWRHVSHADALTVHNEVARRVRAVLAQRQAPAHVKAEETCEVPEMEKRKINLDDA